MHSQLSRASCSLKQCSQARPGLVAGIPGTLEWRKCDPPGYPVPLNYLRCIREVGLWGHIRQSLDATPVASRMGTCHDRPKRASPNSACSGHVGPTVAKQQNLCPVRQHGSGECCQQKKSARDPALSRLLRLLFLPCAIYDITLVARHLPGLQNTAADALSRNNLPLFRSSHPQASPIPTIIPSALQHLLFNPHISANSQTWTSLLSNTLQAASHSLLVHCTPQRSRDT